MKNISIKLGKTSPKIIIKQPKSKKSLRYRDFFIINPRGISYLN